MKRNFYVSVRSFLRTKQFYPTTFRNSALLLLMLTTFANGCKKVDEEPGLTTLCPIVISTNPAKNDTAVSVFTNVKATFNKEIDPSSITTTSFTLREGSTMVPGVITYSGATATFTPIEPLAYKKVYTATIAKGVKDFANNAMIADYVWTFTTAALSDNAIPSVISTDPEDNAVNVFLNKKISASFSEGMNPLTINNSTFLIYEGSTPVNGVVTYSGNTALFSPAVNLLPNTRYTGTITTGAKDPADNSIANNYVWTFTTGATADVMAPTVISTDPANNAVAVPLNKKIAATFSKVMNPFTISRSSFLLKNGTTEVIGSVSYSGTTAIFSPTVNLLANTVYTATITNAVQDVSGNAMASNYVWTFTTGTTADILQPTVISTDPAPGATGVVLDKRITATFSEVMNPLTINSNTFLLRAGTTSIAGVVSYSGTTATFRPAVNLVANTVYTATITTGARDLAGNAMAASYIWSFTTLAANNPGILGSAAMFGAFGGNAGITNQGINSVINNGSIATTAASTLITGFRDQTTGDVYTVTPSNLGKVFGRIYTAPPAPGNATSFAIAQQGLLDATAAYNATSPASMPGGTDPGAGELGGLTLPAGVYQSASGTFKITNGNLTLDGMGNPNATWTFQTGTSLTVGIAGPTGARSIILTNGAQAKNVYWHVGTAATINGAGGGVMVGTIMAMSGVTFSTAGNAAQTVLNGRAISLVASVTMVNTTINVPN